MSENEVYSSGRCNFLEKCPSWFSRKFKPNQATCSLESLQSSESTFCLKIEFWIFVPYMFPHVPKHKTSFLWASETIGINTTSETWDFFKFLWHMDFFMISWKYACFPYYFQQGQNLSLSVSVENHSSIHFLESNKSKLSTCNPRKFISPYNFKKLSSGSFGILMGPQLQWFGFLICFVFHSVFLDVPANI